jgi:glycosyltransferase involved in cell wall biosynthesis
MIMQRQSYIEPLHMKIIQVHNYYQQPGGEDQAFAAESSILEKHGHCVFGYTVHNDCIAGMSSFELARSTIWNANINSELRELVRKVRPDIMHFHNTFPLISPAAYYVARAEGVPVVQTLHNYRLLCPNALLFRNDHVCEGCMAKFVAWPGILYACFRNSRSATSVVACTLLVHRVLRTYNRMVDLYIVLTDFAQKKFIQGGLPAAKIAVKSNFVDNDPGSGDRRGEYAIFAGRLAQEKGVNILLAALKEIGGKIPLKIVGDGPLSSRVAEASRNISGIEWLGHKPRQFVLNLMKDAMFLLFPSKSYEGFPNALVEALACGLPVITSKLGSMAEIIEDGVTGLHFEAGNPSDLADIIQWLIDHPNECRRMGKNARQEYLEKYTAEKNYDTLMNIYQKTIDQYR